MSKQKVWMVKQILNTDKPMLTFTNSLKMYLKWFLTFLVPQLNVKRLMNSFTTLRVLLRFVMESKHLLILTAFCCAEVNFVIAHMFMGSVFSQGTKLRQ